MSFLPISIFAYSLTAGAIIVDKILLAKALTHPAVYVFYISILGFAVIFLLPFGVQFNFFAVSFGILSGIFYNLALLTFFQALKQGEASIVTPVVGSLNPFFSLIIGTFFLGQILNNLQLLAFFIILSGTLILTYNLISNLKLNHQLVLMITAGFLFAISYILLREAFLLSNFITGLTISRLAGGFFVLSFLFLPEIRRQIFASRVTHHHFINKTSLILFGGQFMGASSGLLITYAVFLANPALVNSLFGMQYLVILAVALFLAHEKRSKLLDENLTKGVLVQKILGVGILSLGVYLLSK